MDEFRKKADLPIVAVLVAALVLVPLGVYVGGYFAMTKAIAQEGPRAIIWRIYTSEWQANLFRPAARVESSLRRHQVETNYFSLDTP